MEVLVRPLLSLGLDGGRGGFPRVLTRFGVRLFVDLHEVGE